MADQLLATRLVVTNLNGGATISIPHGLKSSGKGVTPTQVICDRSSPIAVTGCDTLVVTFTNISDTMATAEFRVEFDHSIHAVNTPTVAWQGWDGTAIPAGPAGGDLSGTYPNPTVDGIQGYGIAPNLPNNGDALLFNSALNIWEHAPIVFGGGPPVGPASGDLGGIYPNPSVVGLNTYPLDLTAPVNGDYLRFDGTTWRHTLVTPGSPTAIWGSFCSTVDQTVTTIPSVVTFNVTEGSNGVTVVSGSRLTVAQSGIYGCDISPQLAHSGGGTEIITFWLRVDGVNVPRSASSLEMGNNNNRTLPFLQLDLPLNAGQYIEWVFKSTTATGLTLEHFDEVIGPPAVPAIPSVIANVKRLGSI